MGSRLHSLDAVRGAAALIVLGYHLHTVFGGFDAFRFGYFSVDLFFLLSGFVMARTYERRFSDGLRPVQFFVARFWRLWPTMAVGTCIGVCVAVLSGIPPLSAITMFAATLAFVPHAGMEPFAVNRPAWSIFFEIFANVCHAVVLWRLPIRYLIVFVVFALLAMLPYWAAENFNLGNKSNDFVGGFPRVLFAYSIGVILFRLDIRVPLLPETARPIATYLGALSFPLYAVHYPLLQFAKLYGLGPIVGAVLGMVVAALVVWVSNLQFLPSPRNAPSGIT